MQDPGESIPPLPEGTEDSHLEAAYDDCFELGED